MGCRPNLQIKENLKRTFLNKLSSETQKSGMEYLTKLAHHYGRDPVPGEEAEGSVEGLKRSIEDALKNEDDRWIDEGRPKIFQDMEIVQDYLDSEGEVVLYSKIEFNCVGSLFTVDDYFSPGWEDEESYIHTSNFSCNHYAQGKQIIAHELGHALSYYFKEKKSSPDSLTKYKNLRKCITSNHITQKTGEDVVNSRFVGDSMYSEEDMADVLAYKAFPDRNGPLLFCSLIKPTDDFSTWDKPSIVNNEPMDPHSSPMLRAIMESIYKGRVLSSTCIGLLDHYKEKIGFKTCE